MFVLLGVYVSEEACASPSERQFVSEHHYFMDLVSGLTTPCECGTARSYSVDRVSLVNIVFVIVINFFLIKT